MRFLITLVTIFIFAESFAQDSTTVNSSSFFLKVGVTRARQYTPAVRNKLDAFDATRLKPSGGFALAMGSRIEVNERFGVEFSARYLFEHSKTESETFSRTEWDGLTGQFVDVEWERMYTFHDHIFAFTFGGTYRLNPLLNNRLQAHWAVVPGYHFGRVTRAFDSEEFLSESWITPRFDYGFHMGFKFGVGYELLAKDKVVVEARPYWNQIISRHNYQDVRSLQYYTIGVDFQVRFSR